jgi:hypothetical protein
MVVCFCDGEDEEDAAWGILIHFRTNNQKSAFCLARIHGEGGIFEWERQLFCVIALLVHEHKVPHGPHGRAVGFLCGRQGGRTVSRLPLHYRRTALGLGLSAVRGSGVAGTAA